MYEVDEYTVSLLHFDDGLKDECGKNWTPHGGVAVSTDQKKFGNSSLLLDGVDDYLSIPMSSDFSFTGDFTIEADVFIPIGVTIDDYHPFKIFQIGDHHAGYKFFELSISDHLINVYLYNTSGYIVNIGAPITLFRDTFNNIAVIRKGTQWYATYNGVIVGNATYSGVFFPNDTITVGAGLNQGNMLYVKGYIDELRVSNIARWIALPTNLTATAGDSQITLSWDAVTGATGYNVKRSEIAGGPYTIITTDVTGISYIDNTVTNGTTYYYLVTAVDGLGNESANSNEASATPQAPSGNVLLRVTMIDSSEREYRLSTSESDGFVNWYNSHKSTDTTSYAITDSVDRSKEYLSFDKIISFKVVPLKD